MMSHKHEGYLTVSGGQGAKIICVVLSEHRFPTVMLSLASVLKD